MFSIDVDEEYKYTGFERTIPEITEQVLDYLENEIAIGEGQYDNIVSRIVVSEKEPPKHYYGTYSESELRKELEKLHRRYPEHIRGLEGDPWMRIYWFIYGEEEVDLAELSDLIEVNLEILGSHDYVPEANSRDLRYYLESAKEILCQRRREKSVQGTFSAVDKTITLYPKAFEDDRNKPASCDDLYQVLSHELFHAVHFAEVKEQYRRNDKDTKVVKEASADFFSYLFCKKSKRNLVSNRMSRKWHFYLFSDDPYAKAWFYLHDDDRYFNGGPDDKSQSIAKLKTVIQYSAEDMNKAYDELVPQQYRIFRQKQIHEKTDQKDRKRTKINRITITFIHGWSYTKEKTIIESFDQKFYRVKTEEKAFLVEKADAREWVEKIVDIFNQNDHTTFAFDAGLYQIELNNQICEGDNPDYISKLTKYLDSIKAIVQFEIVEL